MRNVSQFQGLLITEPGDLEFRVEFGTEVASYHVSVSLQPEVESVQANQPQLTLASAPAPR
jgi:hypothetical protein